MLRIMLVGGGLVVVGALFFDPYTFYQDTHSPFVLAPLWRIGLMLFEVVLLLAFCADAWKKQYRRAGTLLCAATLLNVLANALFVALDGVDRFLVMFRTAEILSIYLVMLAVRIIMLQITFLIAADEPVSKFRSPIIP